MIKHIFLLLFTTLISGNLIAQYNSEHINLFSTWKDTSLDHTKLDANYNSVWGWHDQEKKREYAIVGGINGTYFIEVTNPETPLFRAYVKGKKNNCIWREFKTYGHYAYLVSDDAPHNSFQIVDMSYLPDSVHLVHDSNDIFQTAHTLYIDGDILYCAHVRTKDGTYHPMAAYSLADPKNPVLLRSLSQDYPSINMVHDMFVRNDTIYASAGFQGLFILKFNADKKFELLGSITGYIGAGYNHSSWLTPDGKTLVFCDEVPEALPVRIADVSDITDIKITADFVSNQGATAHNPYIVGDKHLVVAYYQDGVQIYDISNPAKPIRTGYFDTHPQNEKSYTPGSNYNGCWGAYPFLPSGILLASDRQNGLFILDAGFNAAVKPKEFIFKIYPNPFTELITIQLPDTAGIIQVKCFDYTGKTVYTNTVNLDGLNLFDIRLPQNLNAGIYFINISGLGLNLHKKILKN
jgi:choice-of-anchor B domain-containing protein